ncbi:hypothetical protein SPI_03579 [Niveomyces insectorum RCEF 264]|uniref:Uncharacterized protein n=1 Tax=Niveomyces insectorum RCEF 264 TaxID=1081102 RepID=A0A167W735_9HYPO|nr:hypothetical protein SPI_03579 [Niveomyces insectorum RCEF 264]
MSQLVDSVKDGLKRVRGAGDAIRGEFMEASDKALETDPNHAQAAASQSKHHALAQKGLEDMSGRSAMSTRQETENMRGGAATNTAYGNTATAGAPMARQTEADTAAAGTANAASTAPAVGTRAGAQPGTQAGTGAQGI